MRFSVTFAAISMSFVGLSLADEVHATTSKIVNIPPESLGTALNTLARQRGFQVIYVSEDLNGVKTPGVKGDLTAEQALHALLDGTGFGFRYVNDRTVTIVPAAAVTDPAPSTANPRAGTDLVAEADQKPAAPPPAERQPDPKVNADLQEVVVTAERREENIQKVPMSITALSQRSLDDAHIESVQDLSSVVPGLDAPPNNSGGVFQANSDIAIRGVFSNGNAPTTQIYIDDTPIAIRQTAAGPEGSFYPDIFDLDRVEVLRGPQGTLFGSSAMGGALRFITPQPNLTSPSGYAKVELGFNNQGQPDYGVGVAYGAPISDIGGFRVSGWFHSDGGYIDVEDPYSGVISGHNVNSSNSYTFRPAVTLLPLDGLSVTGAVFLQHQHSDAPSGYWMTEIPNTEPGTHISGDTLSRPSWDTLILPSLAVKYQLPGMYLQSDTSFLDRYYDNLNDLTQYQFGAFFGPTAVLDPRLAFFHTGANQLGGTQGWQQELRIVSDDADSPVQWLGGLYFHRATERQSQQIYPSLTPVTEILYGETSPEYLGVDDYPLHGQSYQLYDWFYATDQQSAVFVDTTLSLTKKLKLDAGVRYEHSEVKDQNVVVAGPIQGVNYEAYQLPTQVQNPVTPKASLTYQYTDQDMVYATAAKGYRAGGGNQPNVNEPFCAPSLANLGLTSAPTTFTSDKLWSYEIGAKDTLFGGKLAIQTSAFYIDWSNIQTSISLESCLNSFTANQGKAVSQGFDLQFTLLPFEGLKLTANAGYTDAYYPNTGYANPAASSGPVLHVAGDKLPLVLPWTAAAAAEYTRDISRMWEGAAAYFRVDYRWQDAMPKPNPEIATYEPGISNMTNEAYAIVNFRIGVQRNGLDLSAFVDNAMDADPRLGYNSLPGDPIHYASAIAPLTAGITALYRF